MPNFTKYLLAAVFLFIFSHPAMAVEPDIYLTNQSGVRTTQFERDDSIYLEGSCPLAAGSEEGIRIYIAFDKNWAEGDKMSDVSSGIESFKVASNVLPRTLIWKAPLNKGAYDVVIDFNNDLILQGYENCLIGRIDPGFRVGIALVAPPPPPPAPAPTPQTVTTPPPSPAPASAPAPTTQDPQDFSLEDRVEVKNLANVRKSAGGVQLGQQLAKAQGAIIGGPAKANLGGQSFWFWNIDFDEGQDGWVADQTLARAAAKPVKEPTEEPIKEEKVVEPTATTSQVAPEVSSPLPTPATAEKEAAQVSSTADNWGASPLLNAVVIGLAILLGLIIGSSIIARALRKN